MSCLYMLQRHNQSNAATRQSQTWGSEASETLSSTSLFWTAGSPGVAKMSMDSMHFDMPMATSKAACFVASVQYMTAMQSLHVPKKAKEGWPWPRSTALTLQITCENLVQQPPSVLSAASDATVWYATVADASNFAAAAFDFIQHELGKGSCAQQPARQHNSAL